MKVYQKYMKKKIIKFIMKIFFFNFFFNFFLQVGKNAKKICKGTHSRASLGFEPAPTGEISIRLYAYTKVAYTEHLCKVDLV